MILDHIRRSPYMSVAWDSVCTPMWAGGLGIPNLGWLNITMQSKWPWLQRSDPSRPWAEFNINVPKESLQLYRAAALSKVGNGRDTLFWEDRWLQGQRVQELAPNLYGRVRKRIRTTRTVQQALAEDTWAGDVGPELTPALIQEYLTLWTAVTTETLHEDQQDFITWAWETGGCFSTWSAYAASSGAGK